MTMIKEEKFKILIDYILESEKGSYYEYCLEKAELLYRDYCEDLDNYMDNIESEDYLNNDSNKHIYVYAKLLQKHLNLN